MLAIAPCLVAAWIAEQSPDSGRIPGLIGMMLVGLMLTLDVKMDIVRILKTSFETSDYRDPSFVSFQLTISD